MLLLVVLSMLVLFLMIGTAFIITSKQAEKSTKIAMATAIADSNAAARGDLLSDVLLQLVRDTDNPHSSLRYHSLLGDLYGNDGFQAVIQNVQWAKKLADGPADTDGRPVGAFRDTMGVTGGQFVQFEVAAIMTPTGASPSDLYGAPYQVAATGVTAGGTIPTLSSIDGAYNGQIVTFLNGPARGVSTRIVDYRVTLAPGVYQFTVLAFPLADGSPLANGVGGGPQRLNFPGARILVNGRAFSGTGVGYNPVVTGLSTTEPKLNLLEGVPGLTAPAELALLPNAPYFDFSQIYNVAGGMANPELLLTPSQHLYLRSINLDPTNPLRQQEALRLAALVGPPGYGGEDEGYDAADFQNYFLALIQDQPGDRINNLPVNSLRDMVLPSFHRPELINYWRNRLLGAGLQLEINPMMLRKVMSRPSWFDHPNFTGSNANLARWHEAFRFALEQSGGNLANQTVQDTSRRLLDYTMDPSDSDQVVLGPWDVDNDGDGNRDSIWVDFGAPVIMGPNGKLVKPLAAVLCLDLDGRVNLTTAGTLDMADVVNGPDEFPWLAEGRRTDNSPRGIGWGPAEISAVESLGNDGEDKFRRLLAGANIGGRFLPGRYGRDYLDGLSPINVPGRRGFDFQGQANFAGWPQWGTQWRSAFASPPDLRARYGTGVTDYGQPMYEAQFDSERMPAGRGHLTADSPYEARVFAEGTDADNGYQSVDAPFSVAELERILRIYDTDATTLPSRLATLAPIQDPAERNRITVESWQVSTAAVHLPPDLLTLTLPAEPGRPQTTADLLEIRIRATLNRTDAAKYPLYPAPLAGDPNDPTTAAGHVRRLVRQLLAPELAAGLRINVNRPLGNGRDDNLNGVVDEPGEQATAPAQPIWNNTPDTRPPGPAVHTFDGTNLEALDVNFNAATFSPLDVAYEGDPTPGVIDAYDAMLQRQLMARDLYVTALMACAPPTYGQNRAADLRLAERLAQWAVNVVDFRDSDSTMTGFEYDVYPFDGWHVNGLIGDKLPGPDGKPGTEDDVEAPTTDDNQDFHGGGANSFRGVVWGVERPELVISETFATHDRNTTDEADADVLDGDIDTDVENGDDDFDQTYRPRGAFFLELYNPWPANPAASEDTHRIGVFGGEVIDLGVDLAKTDAETNTSPVWRLAVAPMADPLQDVLKDPDDPVRRNRPPDPDRVVYFSGFDPALRRPSGLSPWVHVEGAPNNSVAAYYNDGDDPLLTVQPVRPGRYMVVGSGKRITREGEPAYFSPLGQVLAPLSAPRRPPLRGIELLPTGVGAAFPRSPVRLVDHRLEDGSTARMYLGWSNVNPPPGMTVPVEAPSEAEAQTARTTSGITFPAAVVRPDGSPSVSTTDVAIIDRATRAGAPVHRRLTISEPPNGYPHSVGNVAWVEMDNPRVPPEMFDPNEDGYYAAGVGRDDGVEIGDPRRPKPIDVPLDTGDDTLSVIGTHANYKQVYLQRLANPLVPFDPVSNPYRTVDRATVNITVYNGRLTAQQEENGQRNTAAKAGFSSLERGYRYASLRTPPVENPGQDFNLWGFQPLDDPRSLLAQNQREFDPSRQAKNLASPNPAARYAIEFLPPLTLGFVNRAFMNDAPPAATASNLSVITKRLRPVDPTPWLTWNNRPYVSGNELLHVSHLRSSQLLSNFTISEDDGPAPYENAVNLLATMQGFNPLRPIDADQAPPFMHLENYLFDEDYRTDPQNSQPPRLYRLLELVGTPSLYAQAQTWLNPTYFKGGPPPTTLSYDDPRYGRQPPFNSVSTFREPGKINLNTITSESVYRDLFQARDDVQRDSDNWHPGPEWDDFLESRRGFGGGGGGGDMLGLNNDYPTFFVNPFRPSTMANMVPLANMVQQHDGHLHGVECTLFRSTDHAPGNIGEELQDLLGVAETDDEFNDAEPNAFFRYAPLTRLQNLTGTQSNVFAVWITIGFFEVEEANRIQFETIHGDFGLNAAQLQNLFDRVYPDGYTFGKEDGLDEGNVRRMRGFYIIDRSRPAAFEPGVDRNVENVIRLRRRIE